VVGVVVLVHLMTGLWEWSRGYEDLVTALFLDRDPRFRVDVGGQYRPLVGALELWRLWTTVLLHGDALHLMINVVAIGTLGRILEPWIGPLRFLSWFMAGGVLGAVLTHVTGILQSDGASGGAFALLGAVVVLAWRRRAGLDPDERRILGPVLWGFVGLNLVLSFALPFVNASGHLGGLASGVLVSWLWGGPTRLGRWVHAAWLIVCMAIVGWGVGRVMTG
jgi:MYXO-CTERM domain-containing protein